MGTLSNISIPTSWDQITIRQQMEVERLSEENPDLKSIAFIAGYCNIPFDEVKKMNIKDVKSILERLTFFSEPLPTDPIAQFEYKGETYDVVQSLLKGEFQDYVSLQTTQDNFKSQPYKALPYVVAIMCKKYGESLSDFDVEERASHFLELPISIASRVNAFFLHSLRLFSINYHDLLKASNHQLMESMTHIIDMGKKPVGGGIFTRLLMATLRVYIRFLRRSWKSYCIGLTSKTEKQNWIQKFKSWLKKHTDKIIKSQGK